MKQSQSSLAKEAANFIVTSEGVKVPINPIKRMKSVVESAFHNALLQLYTGDDPRYQGLTKLEVTMIQLANSAAEGDLAQANHVLDRILGLPKQSSENVNVNANTSLSEFLKSVHGQHDPDSTNDPDNPYDADE
ncbi:MAG: hypothetical protein EOL91_08080 [Actinobacteria bacterium]|nr:hypothetical protein [Actinomycetota bacterium]